MKKNKIEYQNDYQVTEEIKKEKWKRANTDKDANHNFEQEVHIIILVHHLLSYVITIMHDILCTLNVNNTSWSRNYWEAKAWNIDSTVKILYPELTILYIEGKCS